MKVNRKTTFSLVIILLCALVSTATATTLIAESGTIPVTGTTRDFVITADSLLNGISGFKITVSLGDPSKAEIIGVTTPHWAELSEIGGVIVLGPDKAVSVTGDTVIIKVMKFEINSSPLSNLELATLNIRGDNNGITGLNIILDKISAANGTSIAAQVQNGTITIGSTPPQDTNGTLHVETNPSGAGIWLDGIYKGASPVTIPNVTAGDHTLKAEKSGYYPSENLVTVIAGITNPVTISLTAIPPVPTTGTMVIQSNPDGADVRVDGTYKGLTNLTIPGISAELHTVRVEKTGYSPWEDTISVAAGGTTVVNVGLTAIPEPPTTGTVNVTSIPPGAEVRLDTVLKGVTPLQITGVAQGIHTVRVELAGYVPFSSPIEVTAGKTTYVAADLEPVPPVIVNGTIEVESNPTGANITLDGVFKQTTPRTIPNVSSGIHTLRLEKTGYAAWEEPVIVFADETTTVYAELTLAPPTTGSVTVESNPLGANVYLDDEPEGTTPAVILDVTPGPHIVRIEKTGYLPYEKEITVTAGGITTVIAALTAEPPPTTGSVDVDSVPRGASVYLDGNLSGMTQVLVTDVEPGLKMVRIEKEGYKPFETAIAVLPNQTVFVNQTLIALPTAGNLDINSTPQGASVYLNDALQVSSTPLLVYNLEPGEYIVRLEKSGYQTWEETFNVTAGDTTEVEAVLEPIPTPTPTLTPTPTPIPTTTQGGTGGLMVISDPTATVFIDGKERGISGEVISNVQAGIRNVTLFKAGYKQVSIPVTINPARPTIVPKIVLEPIGSPTIPPTTQPTPPPPTTTIPPQPPTSAPTTFPTWIPPYPGPVTGSLFVYADPFMCSVAIDDTYRGVTPGFFGQLTPGSHVLKVSRAGYVDDVRSFNVIAGEVATEVVVMVPDIRGIVSALF